MLTSPWNSLCASHLTSLLTLTILRRRRRLGPYLSIYITLVPTICSFACLFVCVTTYSGGTKVSTQTPHMQRVRVASHFPPTPTYFAAFLDKHTIKCIPRNWNILLIRGPELLRDGNWAY